MMTSHLASKQLMSMGVFKPVPTKAMLDSAAAEAEQAKQALLDATANAAGAFAINDIRSAAAMAVKAWAATSDLDEGETLSDRLFAHAVGIANDSQDGDLSEDDTEVIGIALEAMADFLVDKGASEEDVDALLNGADNDAAERVAELVRGAGGDDDADVDNFTFDASSSEAVMDGVLDAVYKKAIVVRNGKKVRINKRISGHVRLSAAQKVAIRKAGIKAHSAAARIRRVKSMKVRSRAGL